MQIPQTGACSFDTHGVEYLTGCGTLDWLDGYSIWDPPPTCPSCGAEWLQIVPPPAPGQTLQSWQISDTNAFSDGTNLNGNPGPWTCAASVPGGSSPGGECTDLNTNASGISNFLNPGSLPAASALRSVG